MANDDVEVEGPFLRTPFNYDRNFAGDISGLHCDDETMTQQSFAEEVDINTIVRRFGLTGQMPENFAMPSSGDFTDVVNDYHSAANMLLAAEDEFMKLPAEMRDRFRNDPQRLMDFIADDRNMEEAIKLGLVPKPEPAPEPLAVRVVEPLAP